MFYIYAYLDDNGIPYYIGKGKGRRAWNKQKTEKIKAPAHDRIVIMEKNLTEIGAMALERRYIRWYGRKKKGGTLLNVAPGGGSGGDDGWTQRQHEIQMLKRWADTLEKRIDQLTL